ncbi:protein OSCP1 [Prorops nasuta]|uniref:protein OSCP1 n=1 Tax=Prorops nasuta TaxID=863751 RepID=UPI0034CD4391
MSLYVTPLLYLNMGGEMLYVLRQRLKAQKIDIDKTIQVLDDVTASVLNPKVLSTIFSEAPPLGLSSLRPTLEIAVLSSIMKLDKDSMDKLFDLMIMMVKYQMTAATGPREVILITLNHTDSMRDMVTDANAQECVGLVHQMILDFYGNLTCEQIWRAREYLLQDLAYYCVRVSVLLRLGLQNEDASFNITAMKYDERYEENRDTLANVKLIDIPLDKQCGGSFNLFGNRITILGRNIYSPTYGMTEKSKPRRANQNFLKDCGTKAELGMLAAQLGTEEALSRPFTLNLFTEEDDEAINVNNEKMENRIKQEDNNEENKNIKVNEEYKNQLDNVYADFFEVDEENVKRMDLLELLDEIE